MVVFCVGDGCVGTVLPMPIRTPTPRMSRR